MPEQPKGRTDDDAPNVSACGHAFVVGQKIAVIGEVTRIWPADPDGDLPPALQVRFINFVNNGGVYVPVPAAIVRAEPEQS